MKVKRKVSIQYTLLSKSVSTKIQFAIKWVLENFKREEIIRKSFINLKEIFTSSQKQSLLYLLPIVIYLVMPSTKAGFSSLTDWADQSTYVTAYDEWKYSHKTVWLDNNWIGPGFIALIRLLSLPFSSTQVALLMASFLGILCSLLILLRQRAILERNTIVSIFMISFVFLTHLQVFKDIPWTHLWVLPMLLSVILLMYGEQVTKLKIFSGGFLLMLAWQLRNFETLALIMAILCTTAVCAFVELSSKRYQFIEELKRKLILLSGAGVSFIFIGILSGQFYIYRQYRPSGTFSDMPPGLDLNLFHGFNRFVQLFINPTFGSLTGYSAGSELGSREQIVVRGSDLSAFWGQSLIHQQPLLLPLIFISSAITLLVAIGFIKGRRTTKEFKVIFCLGLSGLIIVGGYLAQPIIGVGHLKYGIAREFLLPQFLFALQLLIAFTSNRKLYGRTLGLLVFVSIALSLTPDLPDMSNRDYSFVLNANCSGDGLCSSSIEVVTQTGQIKTMHSQPIYIRESCGDKTIFYYGNSDGFLISECSSNQYISVLPTSFGLASTPEGQSVLELKKYKVRD